MYVKIISTILPSHEIKILLILNSMITLIMNEFIFVLVKIIFKIHKNVIVIFLIGTKSKKYLKYFLITKNYVLAQ